ELLPGGDGVEDRHIRAAELLGHDAGVLLRVGDLLLLLALVRVADELVVAELEHLIVLTEHKRQAADDGRLARHVVTLVGGGPPVLVARPQVVDEERRPALIDPAVLYPLLRRIARPEAVGEPGVADLHGALQRNRVEVRRAVADVEQEAAAVELYHHRLMPAVPLLPAVQYVPRIVAEPAQQSAVHVARLKADPAAAPRLPISE